MSVFIAWSLFAASFLVIGIFGYAAAIKRAKNAAFPIGGIFLMIVGAVVSAFVLNGIASQIFQVVEMRMTKELGNIREDQILPDMPNLVTGMIMFGWIFFLAGYGMARMKKPG